MNNISIGILDVYEQKDLDNCLNSIPESLKDKIFVSSNTSNKLPNNSFRFERETSFASLKNHALRHFRTNQNNKYYFLITSNYAVTDPLLFEKTIQLASTFGTWFMTGPCGNILEIEDEDSKLTLSVSPELNTGFLFLHFGIVKNCGYFNEQFYETDLLDVLDYIITMRNKGLYLPHFYNPCINFGLYKSGSKLCKKEYSDNEKALSLSFGLFHHLHQYIPGNSDPQPSSKEAMFAQLEDLQKKYGKK